MANTDHPCVVTIDHRSKPRVLFYGDQFMEVNLPVGTRVIYPKKPMAPLSKPPVPPVGLALAGTGLYYI